GACERERQTVTPVRAHVEQPTGYGRIVRGRDGTVWRIIEDKDATPAERRLTEVNAGTYVVEGEFLFPALAGLKSSNAQKEYYLTDIVEAAIRQGRKVAAYIARDSIEALGVNTRAELAAAERILRDRVRGNLMEAGDGHQARGQGWEFRGVEEDGAGPRRQGQPPQLPRRHADRQPRQHRGGHHHVQL